jgi:N-acetylmuramoyl-L-alanine amidase
MPLPHPPLEIIAQPSPSFGPRKPVNGSTGVRLIVLHYTGMTSAEAALQRLTDPAAHVSSHYVVDDDGRIYRLVDDAQRAWHAGVSYWRGMRDINSCSIGIEITNPGHDYGYRAFPDKQLSAVTALCRSLIQTHGLGARDVVGHSDIAPGRKIDPGELFPWQALAAEGIGMWPTLSGTKHLVDTAQALEMLSRIGYATPLSVDAGADIIAKPSDVIEAFQRHFRPRQITGHLDTETLALIQALAPANLA